MKTVITIKMGSKNKGFAVQVETITALFRGIVGKFSR
jgi:hypothetical protein